MRNLIGVDIGGSKCAAVLGRLGVEVGDACNESTHHLTVDDIAILDKVSFPTPAGQWQPAAERIEETIDVILSRSGLRPSDVSKIGISCGGPLDSRRGTILSPPNLPGWDNVEIVKILEDRFSIEAVLQNDANAGALAEWLFGAARGLRNVVFMTFGTGLGAGLILDGRLYSGTNDMAGEVGHVRLEPVGPVGYGKAGSFEGFCSGGGIAQLARMKVIEKLQAGEKVAFCSGMDQLDQLDARVVASAAMDGDELAREIYRISGHYLGKGLAILIDILNPEIIVIGSVFARATELLWPEAQRVLEEECLARSRQVCRVVPAGLGEMIGDYAALSVAIASL